MISCHSTINQGLEHQNIAYYGNKPVRYGKGNMAVTHELLAGYEMMYKFNIFMTFSMKAVPLHRLPVNDE